MPSPFPGMDPYLERPALWRVEVVSWWGGGVVDHGLANSLPRHLTTAGPKYPYGTGAGGTGVFSTGKPARTSGWQV
jgi:hypothetical protein